MNPKFRNHKPPGIENLCFGITNPRKHDCACTFETTGRIFVPENTFSRIYIISLLGLPSDKQGYFPLFNFFRFKKCISMTSAWILDEDSVWARLK